MVPVSLRICLAFGVAGICPGLAHAADPVPPPAQTPATVIVSGRTSTVKEVKVRAVGNQIPHTFSGGRIKNTLGFSWYVSQHYAFKTDYPEEKARSYLRLLESAYPHYVELFGNAPPGINDKRMAVVYASSLDQLKKAMASDGMNSNFGGGGITYDGINVAYQYPSGTLQYHQRYILLHECTHLFQICLNSTVVTTPAWYYEGVADALGHHVFDGAKQQLTVNVFDKATITNYLDGGLALHRATPLSFEKIHKTQGGGREAYFLVVHYLSSDPERLQKFRIWRDELFRARLGGKAQEDLSARLLQQLFGPWERVDADFREWLARRHNTFHYVEWGWEQDGNALWAYGFAAGGKLSQTDVNLPPGEKPMFDPLRMDYPAAKTPPIVGKVERGVAEPAVGCLIDFSMHPSRGRAGMAMGVISGPRDKALKPDQAATAGMLRIMIEKSKMLVMDGDELGLGRKEFPFPDDFLKAAAAGKHQFGLNARIGAESLEVTLRVQAAATEEAPAFRAGLPLTAQIRDRLLTRPLTMLAQDGYHRLTPYGDDLRRLDPDLLVAAPANRWRNPGDRQLYALYSAAWRLGERTPASLDVLRKAMREAADQSTADQKNAPAAFREKIEQVRADITKCGAEADTIKRALADLSSMERPENATEEKAK